MYQGTTPNIIYLVKNYDLTGAKLFISFKKGNDTVLTITEGYTVAYDDETKNTTVVCPLTQEQTLSFKQGSIMSQIRFIFSNGQAFSTNKVALEVSNVLYPEIISYGGDEG